MTVAEGHDNYLQLTGQNGQNGQNEGANFLPESIDVPGSGTSRYGHLSIPSKEWAEVKFP